MHIFMQLMVGEPRCGCQELGNHSLHLLSVIPSLGGVDTALTTPLSKPWTGSHPWCPPTPDVSTSLYHFWSSPLKGILTSVSTEELPKLNQECQVLLTYPPSPHTSSPGTRVLLNSAVVYSEQRFWLWGWVGGWFGVFISIVLVSSVTVILLCRPANDVLIAMRTLSDLLERGVPLPPPMAGLPACSARCSVRSCLLDSLLPPGVTCSLTRETLGPHLGL